MDHREQKIAMKNSNRMPITLLTAPVALAVVLLLGGSAAPQPEAIRSIETASYIVQGESIEAVTQLVTGVGGTVTRELGIIDGLAAELTPKQLSALESMGKRLSVWRDRTLEIAKKPPKDDGGGGDPFGAASADVARAIGADFLHDQGITGAGVTIAVLDTGYWGHNTLRYDTAGRDRVLSVYNAITGEYESKRRSCDDSGHGTHVLSIIAATDQDEFGDHFSIAPDVDVVAVKAFGEDGVGTYADVIYGLQWILDNREAYGIRVVNLSFSAEPQSYYWDDPLNQAVMALWQNGIVVVASAGNRGPDAMTIGVPGNVPYVITVGAAGDHQIPVSDSNDFVAVFSSAGPTVEGFVKPELIAPGGKVPGIIDFLNKIPLDHPEFAFSKRWFYMSGTSQSTAVVTGIVALMLQESPCSHPTRSSIGL